MFPIIVIVELRTAVHTTLFPRCVNEVNNFIFIAIVITCRNALIKFYLTDKNLFDYVSPIDVMFFIQYKIISREELKKTLSHETLSHHH